MNITDKQREAVAEAMGYEIEDEQIKHALEVYVGRDVEYLENELSHASELLYTKGGRGVDLAEEIDRLRIVIAAMETEKQRG